MTITVAAGYLVEALGNPLAAVRQAAEESLARLYEVLREDASLSLEKRLLAVIAEKKQVHRRAAQRLLERIQKSPAQFNDSPQPPAS
jgi:hypothetical protein